MIAILIASALPTAGAALAQSSRYTCTEVWPPFGGHDRVEATAINDAGDVCVTVNGFPFILTDV